MNIAWIGLGSMGLPTAIKVAAAGHDVRGYDVVPPAPDAAPGITLAASPVEAAAGCDLVCVAVFSDDQMRAILMGDAGVLRTLRAGAVVAIFTTGSIECVREIAAAAPAGVAVLDSCFSRMHAETATGMMTLLVGGEATALDRARPAFESFARAIIHVGPSGSGRAIKLVNNILFAGNLQLAADALHFAEGLGLEPRAAAMALSRASGASDVINRCIEEDVTVMLDLAQRYMVKDVGAAVEAARHAGIELSALRAATRAYVN